MGKMKNYIEIYSFQVMDHIAKEEEVIAFYFNDGLHYAVNLNYENAGDVVKIIKNKDSIFFIKKENDDEIRSND